MTKPRMFQVQQADLFGGGQVVAVVERRAIEAVPARKRRVTLTQLESHARVMKSPAMKGKTLVVYNEITGNWKRGRTRQEIADRAGIKLQTVCGIVNRLLALGKVFEPTVAYNDAGRPVKWQRDGRNVVVDALYQPTWDLTSAVERVA